MMVVNEIWSFAPLSLVVVTAASGAEELELLTVADIYRRSDLDQGGGFIEGTVESKICFSVLERRLTGQRRVNGDDRLPLVEDSVGVQYQHQPDRKLVNAVQQIADLGVDG